MAIRHLLLPTDFSVNSKNAIAYGIQLARSIGVQHITVLHTYVVSNTIASEPILSAGIPELLQEKQAELDHLKEKITAKVAENTNVSTLLLEGKLINITHDLIYSKGIDLIVMGISPKNKLEQTIIGSHAINVMRKTTCPIIVVPENAAWTDHPNMAVAIDITQNAAQVPVENVKTMASILGANKLSLVNVEEGDDHNTHIQNPNIEKINLAFSGTASRLEIISYPNKLQAIDSYCTQKNISLLVLLGRKYGILNTIFHKSLTRQLAYQTHTPILVVEELEEI